MRRQSRLATVEEKRNIKRAYFYIFLSIAAGIFLLFLGLPTLIKFAGFLGDLGKSGSPVEVNDITPPAPPQLDTIPEYTNLEKLDIVGTSENGATITLTTNGNTNEVVANNEGKFNFVFNLNNGDNTIKAMAKDTAGNISTETKAYHIVFDNEDPEIKIESPSDGSSYYGSGQRQLTIKGSISEEVELYINDRFVSLNDENKFSFTTTLSDGENKFDIKAVDPAGNEGTTSFKVNFSS